MDYTHFPTETLLASVIGEEATAKWYHGSLRALFEDGRTEADIALLLVAKELVLRFLHEALAVRDVFSSPDAVKDYLRLRFAGQGHELFVVLFLDAQNRLIAAEALFRGTLTQTAVYPREIVKRALELGACAVILAHNHPSGVAEPSTADINLTEQLKKSLALVDVRVLDHIVVAGSGAVSFAERGLV